VSEPRDPDDPVGDLVARILAGGEPGLARLAAEGLLPIPAGELVPLQVSLALGADPELSAVAASALAALPPDHVAGLLRQGGPHEVLVWFARENSDPQVLEAILRRRDVPRWLLAELAPKLAPKLQELLLLRQDALMERPEIVTALERNPQLSPFSRRRVHELREHLLPAEEVAPLPGEASEAAVAAALEEARARPAGRGERDQHTGLSEVQIRSLPVPVRRRLARGASRTLRTILLRDPHPQVAISALGESGLSDGEIEAVASSRSVVGEVLEEIARHREWVTKNKIVSALVHNPRTPAGVAVRLLPRLGLRELGGLAKDHNVSSAVRTQAQRLYRMKRR
jgi:hypothetical protein